MAERYGTEALTLASLTLSSHSSINGGLMVPTFTMTSPRGAIQVSVIEVFHVATVVLTMVGCNTLGFCAIEGFDLSSGWGSPNYARMAEAVLALP